MQSWHIGSFSPISANTVVLSFHAAGACTKKTMSEVESNSDDGERKTTVSCDTMRKRIKEFLATKQITQTAFLHEIGCNSNSLQRFYRLKGAHNGYQNGAYWGA